MFLTVTRGGYDRHGQQFAHGPFLIVVLGSDTPFREARAFVRHARLHQCGHFMMGVAQVGKRQLHLSGSYGSDGLPKHAAQEVYDAAVPIPADIMEVWATSTSGHNGPGDEYGASRRGADANISELRRAGRKLPAKETP